MTTTELDQAKTEAFAGRMVTVINDAALALSLSIGHRTGLFDTLAHPDLVKNEAPDEWNFARIEPHIQRALDRIAKTGVAMELNTSGMNKALPEMNPGPRILSFIRERGIPVVIGADAHRPQRVADRYEQALTMLDELGSSMTGNVPSAKVMLPSAWFTRMLSSPRRAQPMMYASICSASKTLGPSVFSVRRGVTRSMSWLILIEE